MSIFILVVITQLIQLSQTFELKELKPAKPADYKRVCIYPNWASLRSIQSAQLLPEDVDPHLCTHIHYVYADIDVRTLKLIPSLSEDVNSGKHGRVIFAKITEIICDFVLNLVLLI